ncbi:YybH family protein [Sinomonas mesophila]|uniref:YybH family protein n=1 Tax=Sinomonas mesophila TaxID=1531955 RepID=UPI0011155228|nr:nuclear transport factor 2 family protein [Sinomonas mesophila]
MGATEFDDLLVQARAALGAIVRGDPSSYKAIISAGEDITWANPFGGIARGRAAVHEQLDRAGSYFRDGEVASIETIAKSVGGDLAYTVEIERVRSKVGGRDELSDFAVRVTCVYRREADGWKVLHRHADPRVERQTAESVFQQ